jgi:predicted transport protein
MRELFEEIDKHAFVMGADVSRRIRKQYIGYFRGKRSCFTAEIQQRRVLVHLNLRSEKLQPWNEDAMRDVSNIGHFGMGDTEYSLRSMDQLDEVRSLIKSAYDASRFVSSRSGPWD